MILATDYYEGKFLKAREMYPRVDVKKTKKKVCHSQYFWLFQNLMKKKEMACLHIHMITILLISFCLSGLFLLLAICEWKVRLVLNYFLFSILQTSMFIIIAWLIMYLLEITMSQFYISSGHSRSYDCFGLFILQN